MRVGGLRGVIINVITVIGGDSKVIGKVGVVRCVRGVSFSPHECRPATPLSLPGTPACQYTISFYHAKKASNEAGSRSPEKSHRNHTGIDLFAILDLQLQLLVFLRHRLARVRRR